MRKKWGEMGRNGENRGEMRRHREGELGKEGWGGRDGQGVMGREEWGGMGRKGEERGGRNGIFRWWGRVGGGGWLGAQGQEAAGEILEEMRWGFMGAGSRGCGGGRYLKRSVAVSRSNLTGI